MNVKLEDANKWNKNGYGAQVVQQSGKFSSTESHLVRKAIEEYCAEKQIDTARLCSECEHKAELKGAWMEIAKHLPHRSVQSVYRHGIRQLHPFRRGVWTSKEEQDLVELVQKLGKKWSVIQNHLNRSADSCRDKYREMSDDFVKGRWEDAETDMLKKLVCEYLHVDVTKVTMDELGRLVEENGGISWSDISKRMVKRSRLSCFKKWQKLVASTTTKRAVESADNSNSNTSNKRSKTMDSAEQSLVQQSLAATTIPIVPDEYDEMYSAKMADETVEAVNLPDAKSLEV